MWQTDDVTIQEATIVNSEGVISISWADTVNVITCDVQEINKELVYKKYGYTDADEWLQVFDLTQSELWIKGNQVKFDSRLWKIRKVIHNDKIGKSNHNYILLSEVI